MGDACVEPSIKKKELVYGAYVVAVLDILGQKNAIRHLAESRPGTVDDAEIIKALKDSIGVRDGLCSAVKSSIDAFSHAPNAVPEVDLAQHTGDTRVCGIVGEVYGEFRTKADEDSDSDAKAPKPKKGKSTKPGEGSLAERRHAFTSAEMASRDSTKIERGQIGWMVTLGAFAHCKVDADIAPIKVGDLLTTSPTKGHAQKVTESGKATGAILGKALASLKKGKGKIPVMVMLQ